jgi:AcrR family transcriptional regulator
MQDAVHQIRAAIERGELREEDLTARGLAAALGKTTSVLYHHWGSVDLFLYDVAQSGYAVLAEQMAGASLEDAAERYVRFAVERPVLYGLMFHRQWDWAAVREARDTRTGVGFLMWRGFVERVRAMGSPEPDLDARVLYGALHGIASLAITGRANVGNVDRTDLETAVLAARRAVTQLLPEVP